jgi:hypothetical protein
MKLNEIVGAPEPYTDAYTIMKNEMHQSIRDPKYGVTDTRRPFRPCLNCGKNHNNANSFCSKECCKEYKKISIDIKS